MNAESILKEKGTEVCNDISRGNHQNSGGLAGHAQRTSVLWWSGNDAVVGLVSERDIVRVF